MASLTGNTIQSTYDSLLKVTDNDSITGSLKRITDGLGNNTPLYLSNSAVEIVSALNVTGAITGSNLSGTNTGDETKASIETKLGAATSSNSGYLTSTDWSTFNNKIAGTGTLNKLAKFSSSSSIADSTITDTGSAVTIGVATSVTGSLTASSIIKSGGTASQILAADGSVITAGTNITISGGTISSSGGISGSGTTNYVPKFTGSTSLGNSLIFDNGTNVGIGTTTPATRLEVRNNASSPIGWGGVAPFDNRYGELTWDVSQAIVQANSGYALQFNTNGANERMRITSGGNVGIGTSSPAGTIDARRNASGYVGVFYNSNSGGEGITIRGGSTSANNALVVQSHDGGRDILIARSDGNVGIGTSSPSYVLDAYSTGASTARISIKGTTNYSLLQSENDSGTLYLGIDSSTGGAFGTGAYSRLVWGGGAYPLVFGTNATERMRITSTGNVGIGTSSPSDTLHVAGNIRVGNSTNNYIRYRTASNWDYYLGATNDDFRIYDSQSTNFISLIYNGGGNGKYTSILDKLYVFNTGNVGIGTSSPRSASGFTTLALNNASNGGLIDFLNNGTLAAQMYNTSSVFNIGSVTAIPFVLATSDTERMRITSGGNVGIGTTNPTDGRLQVAGNTQLGNTICQTYFGVAAYSQWITSTGAFAMGLDGAAGTTERMRITSGGNVGIGIASPSYKLQVRNDVLASTSLEPITLGLYNNSDGGSAIYFSNGVGGQSKLSFGVESTGAGTDDTYLGFSTGANTTLSERMRITSGGNVGIGTSSPSVKLQVIGDIATSTRLVADTINGYTGGGTPITIQTGGAQDVVIGTNTTERMRITSAGNVGIGTSSPSQLLHVRKDQNAYTWSRIDNQANNAAAYAGLQFGAYGNSWGIAIGSSLANSNALTFVIDAGGGNTERMRITSAGNVGIGCTPNYGKVEIQGATTDKRLYIGTNIYYSNSIDILGLSSVGGEIPLGIAGSQIQYYTNSTERMRIFSGGNVAIGSSTDNNTGAKLQVTGGMTYQNLFNRRTASYTLTINDQNYIVEMNVGSANNLTIPPNSSAAFPIGTEIAIIQYGAGQTTIVAGAGVTLRSKSNALKISGQYAGCTCVKVGTDEWYVIGDLTL